ncbi:hypothetical protein FI667_g13853, partial [Globisporangium splendens]
MRVKVRVAHEKTWISALPESLKHEFSMDELEQMKEQFSDFDTSGDGSITASELVVLMKSMGIDIALDDLISEFRRGNSDKLATFIQYSKSTLEIRKELTDLTKNPTPLSQAFAVKGTFVLLNGTMSLYGLKDRWEPEWRMRGLIERVETLRAVPDADLINAFYEETLQLESLAARAQTANGSPTKKGNLRQPRDVAMECINAYLLAPEKFAQIAQDFTAKCAIPHTMESIHQ